jgi:hypothetical protein
VDVAGDYSGAAGFSGNYVTILESPHPYATTLEQAKQISDNLKRHYGGVNGEEIIQDKKGIQGVWRGQASLGFKEGSGCD